MSMERTAERIIALLASMRADQKALLALAYGIDQRLNRLSRQIYTVDLILARLNEELPEAHKAMDALLVRLRPGADG